MSQSCQKCGYAGLRITLMTNEAICLRPGCSHPQKPWKLPIVPAGEDCRHTSVCQTAMNMSCLRSQWQGKDYPCASALNYEGYRECAS